MFGIKKEPKPRKNLHIAIVCAVVVVFIASAAVLFISPEGSKVTINMNKNVCESSGGVWNECGSPCLGAPQGTICILVCREQCEWHSTSATLIQADAAYSSQPGFKCMLEENGIPMCWLPGSA